jgi:enoyl-[acyl-carrier protein] reductase/trans-2-enoyl-CoA reductase (NAD+)
MSMQVVAPRVRGFMVANAHPAGCRENVRRQIRKIREARQAGSDSGLGHVLVVGASSGYGLASVHVARFGYGASVLGVALERPPSGSRTGTGGWYNLVATRDAAEHEGGDFHALVGDAFADETKEKVQGLLQEEMGPLDLLVYSLASPRRKDPDTETTWSSYLKPVGEFFDGNAVDPKRGDLIQVTLPPAELDEIESTVKVMGGEDWRRWVQALGDKGLLARGFRTVAYSYQGPRSTWPLYRWGTIGRAKAHLESTARRLDQELREGVGGGAWVSVNKAVVTQASIAIPGVPAYMSALYRIMKQDGSHEDASDQMVRLFQDHLGPGQEPSTDHWHRIRLDDRELDPAVQERVQALCQGPLLAETGAWEDFQRELLQIHGFAVPGVDYDEPVEIDLPI